MIKEVYVEVKGFDGQYLVSNMGNMKTRSRYNPNEHIPLNGWKVGVKR